MSTRATIQITDGDESFYLYRHCDGFPEDILPDIAATIEWLTLRGLQDEAAMVASHMIAANWDTKEKRLPIYELTGAFHGDESYRYFIRYDKKARMWKYGETPA